MKTIDICINGAGPVGATLACLLVDAGLSVLLIERSALPDMIGPGLDGRAYAISEGSRRILQQAGVWQRLPCAAQPIQTIAVEDGLPDTRTSDRFLKGKRPSNRASLIFAHDDYPAEEAGLLAFGWMVEATDLRKALNDGLLAHKAAAPLEIAAPNQAHFTFDTTGATVTLDTGETYRARLVIAAEGRQSPLRQQARIPLTRLASTQSAIITIIQHVNPHHGSALERFLEDGPFARLPLPATSQFAHRSAIVWAAATPRANYLYNLPQDAFQREIQQRVDTQIGDVIPIGPRWIYPLSAQYAHTYVTQRLALIGDAAHGLHPIAGQGLNLGFRDIRYIMECLTAAFRSEKDIGHVSVLTAYQSKTRPHNMAMMVACDVVQRTFASGHPALRMMRQAGLSALGKKTLLRASFIRKTMGLS